MRQRSASGAWSSSLASLYCCLRDFQDFALWSLVYSCLAFCCYLTPNLSVAILTMIVVFTLPFAVACSTTSTVHLHQISTTVMSRRLPITWFSSCQTLYQESILVPLKGTGLCELPPGPAPPVSHQILYLCILVLAFSPCISYLTNKSSGLTHS